MVARSAAGTGGVFSGLGVSSSFRADLVFPAFVLRETSLDFFDFGLGVGVWRRFDFAEVGSGVSRGVGLGVASSSSSDFGFALRRRGDARPSCDSLSLVDPSFAAFALGIGVGDFFSFGEESVFFCDSSLANFAWGIAVGAFSEAGDPPASLCEALWAGAARFFPDLSLDPFATGLGDFFGFGDGEECGAICSDSSRRLFSSPSTCAQRRLPRITPETNDVVSQTRKRTTATERNRARDAINQFVKKVKRVTKLKRRPPLPF